MLATSHRLAEIVRCAEPEALSAYCGKIMRLGPVSASLDGSVGNNYNPATSAN